MTNVVAMIIMLTSPLSIFPFEQCEKFSASMQNYVTWAISRSSLVRFKHFKNVCAA